MNKLTLAKNLVKIQASILGGTPFYSTLFVTRKCNSECVFCNVHNKEKRELTLEEIKRIIDEMDDFGIRFVTVTWGEPILRRDIFEILHHIESKKMLYSMVSNGTLWNEEKIDEIRKRRIFTLSFSLDSLSQKKYREIRSPSVRRHPFLRLETSFTIRGFAIFPSWTRTTS